MAVVRIHPFSPSANSISDHSPCSRTTSTVTPCEGSLVPLETEGQDAQDMQGLSLRNVGVKLLDLLRRLYPNDFRFLEPVREGGKPFISLLAGHREFENPAWNAAEILSRYARESDIFRWRKAAYEIYPNG